MADRQLGKKLVSIFVMITFFFYVDVFLYSQSEDEIVKQFHRAKGRYISGQYNNALKRIERVIGIIDEKEVDRKDILGMCYLLMGAIYEKEAKPLLAEENYKKAKNTYGITLVDTVDLESLPIYRKVIKGEGLIEVNGTSGTIVKTGTRVKKKKFPWLIVAGAVVVLSIAAYLIFKKKKKRYTLTIERGAGVSGSPANGSVTYSSGALVDYSYTADTGFGNLQVTLDGNAVAASGTVTMDGNHTLRAAVDSLGFETNVDTLDISEGSIGAINMRLSARPENDVQVIVEISGDPDIQITAGASPTFTIDNWNAYQTISLRALEDEDIAPGEAVVRITAPASGITAKEVVVTEVDNDNLGFVTNTDNVTVDENGTAFFRVKLAFAPTTPIQATVAWLKGDRDISIRSGSVLNFNAANWYEYQSVVLQAADDSDTASDTAYFRITAEGLPSKDIRAVEGDDDVLHFETDKNSLSIDEGGTGTFQVRLSAQPDTTITATVSNHSGDTDIQVQSSLTFTGSDWDKYKTVTLTAAEDDDIVDGDAVIRVSADSLPNKDLTVSEIDNDTMTIETDAGDIIVDEGGSASFQVRLTAQPSNEVTVMAARHSGDTDIDVTAGAVMAFNSSNWHSFQTVTVSAGNDEDALNGSAVIRVTSTGLTPVDVTATENDLSTGEPPQVAISTPQNGSSVWDDVTIVAVANDDYGVTKVEFYVDDALMETDTSFPHQYTWPTKTVSDGAHTIKVIAYDAVDQTAESSISVTVTDSLPRVTIPSEPAGGLSGTTAIRVDAEDYRGVQSIRFFIDGTELTAWNSGPLESVSYDFLLNTTLYSNGSHTFRAIAVDTAAQESTAAEITITINN